MNRLLRDHLDKLHPFVRIAESRSLRQAAEALRVSLPSVMHTVKILEDATGTKLVQRSRSGIRVTPEGLILLEFARRTLQQVEEAEARLRTGSPRATILRIGTFETLAVRFWPPFIRDFSSRHPGIAISLLSRPQEALLHALEQGEIHAAIALEPAESVSLTARRVIQESFGLFASRGWLSLNKLAGKPLSREDLRSFPLTFVPDARISAAETLESCLWRHGLEGRLSYKLDSFEAVYQFVAHGIGIGVLPKALFSRTSGPDLRSLHIQGIRDLGAHSISWIQPLNASETPSLRVLRSAIRDSLVD